MLDFRVTREENVFPMIPSGKTYHDLILNADTHLRRSLALRVYQIGTATVEVSRYDVVTQE